MRKLSIAGILLLMGMAAAAPWHQPVQSATANPVTLQDCFAEDPAIGGMQRDPHHSWAQQQDSGRLENNLRYKISLLFNCSAVDGEKLANAFADISVIIARYVATNNCFEGPHVKNPDRAAHESWARSRTRNQVRDNLQWKAAATVKCLDRNTQNDYFADISVAVAKVPSASTGGGVGGGSGGRGCQGATNYVTINPSTAQRGQSITVQVTTTAPPPDSTTRSWVALFEAGGQSHLGQWKWLSEGQDCGFTFRAPDAPGQYEFRYLLDSGYDKVAARGYLTVQ